MSGDASRLRCSNPLCGEPLTADAVVLSTTRHAYRACSGLCIFIGLLYVEGQRATGREPTIAELMANGSTYLMEALGGEEVVTAALLSADGFGKGFSEFKSPQVKTGGRVTRNRLPMPVGKPGGSNTGGMN